MTHDELVKDLDACIKGAKYGPYEWGFIALRAVVALHKPDESDFPDEWESCVECSCNGYVAMYPCQTIKAIEKELE
jgi:hypothetical protein